jgi:hypothetical protein
MGKQIIASNKDLDIEDVIKLHEMKKKKKNSGSKGKRGERSIVDDLNQRFDEFFQKHPEIGRFSRSVGSGNRVGQGVWLSQQQNEVYSGDIICQGFLFVVESKSGYDIDLHSVFKDGNKEIDSFLEQVSKDAERTHKLPMLIYKKDRRERLVFVKRSDLTDLDRFVYYLIYRDWVALTFDKLFSLPDEFFFLV